MPRRRFLASAGVLGGSLALGCRTTQPAAEAGWVDAHVHLWSPDLTRYPISPEFKPADMQPASFVPEQLFAHLFPLGVGRIVLIQMSFYGFDNRYMLECMQAYPGKFRGIAVVDEHSPSLSTDVQSLHRQGVRGFRISPGKRAIANWLETPGMRALWTLGGTMGMALCPLINPAALPAIGKMATQFPDTRVVIDHFARIGTDGQMRDADLDALCALATLPNVHVKTSAFYALGKKQPPYTDLAPMIRRVRDAFGADRLMWGSDCPYQVDPGHTYAASVELIRDRLEFLTTSERTSILKGTAARLFFT